MGQRWQGLQQLTKGLGLFFCRQGGQDIVVQNGVLDTRGLANSGHEHAPSKKEVFNVIFRHAGFVLRVFRLGIFQSNGRERRRGAEFGHTVQRPSIDLQRRQTVPLQISQ